MKFDEKFHNQDNKSLRGSPPYLSPELFYLYFKKYRNNKELAEEDFTHYDPFKSDMFSLGIILIRMFSSLNLYKDNSRVRS